MVVDEDPAVRKIERIPLRRLVSIFLDQTFVNLAKGGFGVGFFGCWEQENLMGVPSPAGLAVFPGELDDAGGHAHDELSQFLLLGPTHQNIFLLLCL